MRLLDMEDMLLAAERGEVSESHVGPLYAALCALPSCARGFLSGDVVVAVTWALGAVASQVMRGLCPKHELWSARRCCRARRLGLSCCCVARRRPRSRRESGVVELRSGGTDSEAVLRPRRPRLCSTGWVGLRTALRVGVCASRHRTKMAGSLRHGVLKRGLGHPSLQQSVGRGRVRLGRLIAANQPGCWLAPPDTVRGCQRPDSRGLTRA